MMQSNKPKNTNMISSLICTPKGKKISGLSLILPSSSPPPHPRHRHPFPNSMYIAASPLGTVSQVPFLNPAPSNTAIAYTKQTPSLATTMVSLIPTSVTYTSNIQLFLPTPCPNLSPRPDFLSSHTWKGKG